MAVQPNSTSYAFTTWALATSWLEITASQRVLVTQIQTAANDQTTVTDHVWNQFLRVSGLWYQYYIAFIAQTTTVASIPSGIAQGDLLYGSAANTLSRLAKSGSASRFLKNSGTNNNPAWVQPAITDLSDFVDWTDFSTPAAPTGFSGTVTQNTFRYTKFNKLLTIYFYYSATSNLGTFTFTLPFKSANTNVQRSLVTVINNNVAGVGIIQPTINSFVCNVYRDLVATAFTASGVKGILGNFTIEVQ